MASDATRTSVPASRLSSARVMGSHASPSPDRAIVKSVAARCDVNTCSIRPAERSLRQTAAMIRPRPDGSL